MAIVGFLFGLVILVLIIGIVIAIVQWVIRALAALAVLAGVVAGAVGLGLVAGLLASVLAEANEAHDPSAIGSITGILVAMATLGFAIAWWTRHTGIGPGLPERTVSVRTEADVEPALPPPPPLVESDPAVRAAWDKAADLLPQRPRALGRARGDCAELLALAEDPATGLDVGLIDAAAHIRKQVPELVKFTADLWPLLGEQARIEHGAQLLASLDLLAGRARAERDRYRERLEERLAAVHAHIAARAAEA